MSADILFCDGVCYNTIRLDEFSEDAVLEFLELTRADVTPTDRVSDASAITSECQGEYGIITVFDFDGAAKSFIGPGVELIIS